MPHPPIDEAPLDRLLAGLLRPVCRGFTALRRPGMIWLRLPLGALLVIGSVGFILPVLGLWMLPVGLILLAEDIPALKRPTMRGLAAIQSWYDRRWKRA